MKRFPDERESGRLDVMKLILIALLATGGFAAGTLAAADAPDAPKPVKVVALSAAEQNPILRAQKEQSDAHAAFQAKVDYYQSLIAQQKDYIAAKEASDAADRKVNDLATRVAAAHECVSPACRINDKTLDLEWLPTVTVTPGEPKVGPPTAKGAK